MRKTRTPLKIASLLLALVLVAAVIPAAPAGAIGMGNVSVNFSDVPEDSWYHDYVYLCATARRPASSAPRTRSSAASS